MLQTYAKMLQIIMIFFHIQHSILHKEISDNMHIMAKIKPWDQKNFLKSLETGLCWDISAALKVSMSRKK